MTKQRALANSLLVCGLLAASGCSDAPAQSSRGGGEDMAKDMDLVVYVGDCSPDNLTTSCTCDATAPRRGRQVCRSGRWDGCECAAPQSSSGAAGTAATAQAPDAGADLGEPAAGSDPAGNRSSTRFDWQRTPLVLGSCKAGHYVGEFMGTYRSPIVFGWPVMVNGEPGADGAPGLEFWLEKTPGSGEVFSVNGGKLRGTANGSFPFTGDLTGTLDCATKKYIGKIENGVYLVIGLPYTFVGEVTADYDKLQNSFINGRWILTEPATGNALIGGEIDWSANWSAM